MLRLLNIYHQHYLFQSIFRLPKQYFDYRIYFRYPQYYPTDSSIIMLEKIAVLPIVLMKRTHFLSFWHCHFAIKEKKYKGKRKNALKSIRYTFVFKKKKLLAVNLYELTITKIIFPIEIGFSLCPLERKWNCQKRKKFTHKNFIII